MHRENENFWAFKNYAIDSLGFANSLYKGDLQYDHIKFIHSNYADFKASYE